MIEFSNFSAKKPVLGFANRFNHHHHHHHQRHQSVKKKQRFVNMSVLVKELKSGMVWCGDEDESVLVLVVLISALFRFEVEHAIGTTSTFLVILFFVFVVLKVAGTFFL